MTPARLALILAVLVLLGAGASPAAAGEYPVYACEPGAGDVNHAWVPEWNHGGVVAYANCPPPGGETRSWNRGLVVRSKFIDNARATVPTGSYAALVLRAPPGASLARISYDHDLCGFGGFSAGLANGAGTWIRRTGPLACGTWFGRQETLALGGTNLLKIITQCVDGPCLVGTTSPAGFATFRSATVIVADSTPPNVSLTGGSGWRRGRVEIGISATDNVGVRYAELGLAGHRGNSFANSCNNTSVVPCPALTATLGIDTRVVPDGRHDLSVNVQDAANNWQSVSSPLLIDNAPPSTPLGLKLAGGHGWRQQNNFSLSWINPQQKGMAPITRAQLAVCPAANAPEMWTGCRYGGLTKTSVTKLPKLQVPAAGDWTGRLWLRDAAGNDDRRTAAAVPLRFDDTPPTASFGPVDPADPARVDLIATDATSPLTRGEIEIRRKGAAAWLPVPTAASPQGFVGHVDDEHLPDGIYHLRARVYDSAGNVRSIDQDAKGSPIGRSVPLRIDTQLVAGQVKYRDARRSRDGKRRSRRVVIVRPKVRYGRTIPIRGRLTTPGNNPVANASVEVWQRIARPGASWKRVAMLGTDAAGRFKFKALRGPSRILRFRYPGTPLVRARTKEVEIRVKAGTSMRANRTRVVNGDEVVFRGRVKGRPLPNTGKLIQLQVYSRGTWLTFATPRAKARSGRWRHRYRFTATRGTVRYRFRARLPREAGYPYATGTSRDVNVIVRGL